MNTLIDSDLSTADDDIIRRAQRRLALIKTFYGHLAIYVGVNALLHVINLVTTQRYWAMWPLLGWGIAIAVQAAATFDWPARLLAPDWEQRKLRQLIEDERQKTPIQPERWPPVR
jgi:hypothetical protein